jgi:hypothetical protein
VLSLLLAALHLGPQADAAPTRIASCGTTATTDVKLVIDLTCPDAGIVVGGNGITIDLNGYTLTGDRTPAMNGVDNGGGFDDVTVKNGAVEKFSRGVVGIGANRMHVTRIASTGNLGVGILISGGSALVSSSDASSNSDADNGISIVGDSARVKSTRASANGHNGISISGASASVTSSQADANEGDGIHIVGSNARVRSSRSSSNDDDGIDVEGDSAKIGQLRGGRSSDRNHADANGFPDGASDGFGQGYYVHGFSIAQPPTGRNEARSNDDPAQCNPATLC